MNESMDRVLADWLREGPEAGPREGLERALAATRRVGQKPGWAIPERWIPMQLTMARTPSLRPILAMVMVALLIVALAATALFIGSRPRALPAPFGPALNGAIVYDEAGELFIANDLTGEMRPLVTGPETDGWPGFSNQGDRIAFIRVGEGDFQVMSVLPDGSNVESLAELPGDFNGYSWSPTGEQMLVNFSESGPPIGFRFALVITDGSGFRELDLGVVADYAGWRPNGEHIVFRGHDLEAGTSSVFIANADGTNVRRLDIPATQDVDFENLGWSPNGEHLAWMSAGVDGVTGWQINIADIDAAGNLTDLRPLKLDRDSSDERNPGWSPDSTKLSFMQEKDGKRQIGIFNADGTGYRLVGPETSASQILGATWSPDGKTLLITEFPDFEPAREELRKVWSVDVATGEQTEVPNPVSSWQRTAP
jgi:Tol biopolymer transport system component